MSSGAAAKFGDCLKLGIFGGTFDPIHYGHLRMAEEARERIGLDRVLFVPNQVSPFKVGKLISPCAQRIEMIRLAISGNPAFEFDTIELDRPGPSYTVDTLRAIKLRAPAETELFFLTGADAVRDLAGWREPEEILRLTRLVAATRPGVSSDDIVRALPAAWRERILFLEMPELDIAATDLRERIRTGRSIRYLTSPAVEKFVTMRGLYRAAPPEAGASAEMGESDF